MIVLSKQHHAAYDISGIKFPEILVDSRSIQFI